MARGYRDAWLLAALLVARAATQTLNSTSAYVACVASPGSCTSLAFVEDDPLLRSGSLPSELGDFTALTQLVLNKIGLSGTLPSELGSLSALQRLLLANNALVGEIPSELGLLSADLLEVQLELNILTGYVPTEIGALSGLTRCYLSHQAYASRTNLLSLHANSTIDQLCRVRTADNTSPPPSPPSSSESLSSTTIEANLQARVPYVSSCDRRTFMIVIPTLFLICCGGLVHMFCVQKREEGLELASKRKTRVSLASDVETITLAAKGLRHVRMSMKAMHYRRSSSIEGQEGAFISAPATCSITHAHGPGDIQEGGIAVAAESVQSEKQDQVWSFCSNSSLDSTPQQAPYSSTDVSYSTIDAVPAAVPRSYLQSRIVSSKVRPK
ncbi:hypothetical protein T492DRAFT_986904 [Pavlovales sp. CCMP2436]|nr:hypothetical protein T492DRAFT_986904 [Pavlovales sp. CCMP2436]